MSVEEYFVAFGDSCFMCQCTVFVDYMITPCNICSGMAEPSPKKVKMSDDDEDLMEEKDVKRIQAQLKSESGEVAGAPFDLPIDITAKKLQLIINAVLQKVCKNLAYCTV